MIGGSRNAIGGALLGLAALGACARPAEAPVRVAVDVAIADTGVVEWLRKASAGPGEVWVVEPGRTTEVIGRVERGEVELALLAERRPELGDRGLLAREAVLAHEELVFIGPADDPLGAHAAGSATDVVKNLTRSGYRTLLGRPGSVEERRVAALFAETGDREPSASFVPTALDGDALVARAIAERAFALVRRSAIVSVAKEQALRPHRVYADGLPELLLPVTLVEVHPARTGRAPRPGAFDALVARAPAVFAAYGRDRFGAPLYSPGEPRPGKGASAPSP